jgi:drug/metabolite transporter (DMT)-like permease
MKPSGQARGALLVVAATAGFASLGTLAGLAERAGMGSSTFVALRAALGAALLAGLLALRPGLWVPLSRVPARQRVALGAAVAVNGAFNLALFGAFALATVPVTLAIYFTYPALVAAASVALGRERLTAMRFAGLALAAAGIALLLGGRLLDGGRAEPMGLVLAATAATLQASYLVISRSGFPAVAAEQAITLVLAGGAAMAAIIVLAAGEGGSLSRWAAEPAAWLAVVVAAVVGTAAAKVWVLRGLRILGGTRTAVIMLGEPLGGTLLAAAVLGQSLAPVEGVGGLLIVVAALLVQRPAPGRASSGE